MKSGKEIKLETKRLVLKPMTTKYLQSTFLYSSDFENTKYMLYLPNETVEDVMKYLTYMEEQWQSENQTYFEFAIFLEEKHIGAIGVDYNEEKTVLEFGWIVDKNYWGNGYVTEAAFAVKKFAIEQLGAKHFVAHCDSENIPSQRVMEKLGMKITGSCGGRKNKGSDEERIELTFEYCIQE